MPDATTHYNLQKAGASGVQNKFSLYDADFDLIERGRSISALAGENLVAGDLVYVKASDQKLWKATNSERPLAGIVVATANTGTTAYAQEEGLATLGSWTWTAGGLVYAHPTTAGALTQTVPIQNPIPIGIALAATTIWLFRSGFHRDTLGHPRDHFRQVGTSPLERWYLAGHAAAAALGTVTPTIDILYAFPFFTGRKVTLDRIGLNVTTVAGAGGKVRLGIYEPTSLTNLYPAVRVLDGGELLTDGSTGVKSSTITQVLQPDALYWLVALFGTAAPIVRAVLVAGAWPIFGIDNAFGTTPGVGLSVAQTYGALPATYPAAGTVVVADFTAIGVRLSA